MNSLYKQYHEASKLPHVYSEKVQTDNSNTGDNARETVSLEFADLPEKKLSDMISERSSSKSISKTNTVSKSTLSSFLEWSCGKKKTDHSKRTYPSPECLYPDRIFIAVEQVENLEQGLYEYIPEKHSLEMMNETSKIHDAFVQPGMDYNFCVIIAADFEYATNVNGERGYRLCLLEAGHIVQNMLLISETLNLATRPIGAFKDDYFSYNVLPKEVASLCLVPVGGHKGS